MRICVLARDFPAPSEPFVARQVERLRMEGHQVHLLAVYRPADLPDDTSTFDADLLGSHLVGSVEPRGTQTPRLLWRALRSALRRPLATARSLSRYVPGGRWPLEAILAMNPLEKVDRQYDVIHAHFGPTGTLAVWLRHLGLLHGPVITTFHGFDVTALPGSSPDGDYSYLLGHGDAFTVNTAFLRSRVLDLGEPEAPVTVLPVGVDVDRIAFSQPQPSPGEARLLTVARLVECKGIDYALRAVQRLVWRYPRLRYTIIGAGPLDARLQRLAIALGISDNVRFLGALPYSEVLKAYREHDIFLLPGVVASDGHVEAQGRVLLEAQAAGLLTVASDVGGVSEVLHPDAGVLVAPRDDEAIVRAVVELLTAERAWGRRAAVARRWVEDRFDEQVLHNRLLDLYRSVRTGEHHG